MANQNLGRKAQSTGVAFTSDLSGVGAAQGGAGGDIFRPDQSNVLDQERRLIDKVFSIVDKDNSGAIDAKELEEMFSLFGVETHFLTAAIDRVLANADKDRDGMISPAEFYKLLSQKFNKGDSVKEMEDVFDRMGAKPAATRPGFPERQRKGKVDKDVKEIGIKEMYEVAQMLGESQMTKMEIKDMIQCFKRLAAASKKTGKGNDADPNAKPDRTASKPLREAKHYEETDELDDAFIFRIDEFIEIMNMEL